MTQQDQSKDESGSVVQKPPVELLEKSLRLPAPYVNKFVLMKAGSMAKLVFLEQAGPAEELTVERCAVTMDAAAVDALRQILTDVAKDIKNEDH